MNDEEIKQMCLQLMETSKAAYLTTIDAHGYPHTRAMFNLRNKELWPKLHRVHANTRHYGQENRRSNNNERRHVHKGAQHQQNYVNDQQDHQGIVGYRQQRGG